MNSRRFLITPLVVALAGSLAPLHAEDAIRVLCSNGLKAVVEDLVPKFERETKHKVSVQYGLAASLKQRIENGEAFDVAFLTPAAMDDLVKQGKIVAETRATIARTGLGIAIRKGARKPDVKTADSFKRALLDAKGIAYAKEGASGVAFAALIQKLGIANDLKAKSKLTVTGEEVGEAVLHGDSEFGILPLSEILPIKGAELGGMFPADVQSYIVMQGGVSRSSKQQAIANDLLKYHTAAAALPVITAKGMER